MSFAFLTWEHLADFGYWLLFFFGQSLYVLKRAGSAIRSPTNPIKSRFAFVEMNWDILAIRMVLETIIVFWTWRHVSIAEICSWFSVPYPHWLPAGVTSSWIAPVTLGYAADGLLDWLGQWKRTPDFVKQFIKEQVPELPTLQKALVTAAKANVQAADATVKAGEAIATAQDVAKKTNS